MSHQEAEKYFKRWIRKKKAWSSATNSGNCIRREFAVIASSTRAWRGYISSTLWTFKVPQKLESAVLLLHECFKKFNFCVKINSLSSLTFLPQDPFKKWWCHHVLCNRKEWDYVFTYYRDPSVYSKLKCHYRCILIWRMWQTHNLPCSGNILIPLKRFNDSGRKRQKWPFWAAHFS